MTTVNIKLRTDYLAIELSGHAGYANRGHDIVCAAISMASQMLILGLKEVAHMTTLATLNESQGYMQIQVNGILNPKAQALVETFILAVNELSSQYPENIQVYLQ